ncbi:Aspartyl-tRNA(Asn) amidotransferase subunit A [Dissulfuribacter thermophilus]|uniref:Glutamyl-tRNA(Gln) amidotransferase subunit A n=1 Tax=Dissulfuribacter thermophilus TaxID=1156395 RepID=A0A1B9F955_9BACT|nr:Asp-tRNA(Asn)/Glu-tRNA(Gln) amidotransferase subunit GatA [Dissulfuribacter thermophilus]OCC16439.1 Aspartyl-tRNA(Asn) amidotransferase subunit A [Dissulfuribacter thermophilus]
MSANTEITDLTLWQLRELLLKKELSAKDVAKAYLERISLVDPKVKAYITVTEDLALKQAEEADNRILKGDVEPLTGIPIALKDVLCTKGVQTTCASKILENFVPPYDATVVKRLKGQGAVILGKLNMDEFAMGSSTENSAFFPTKNPWNLECIPGGSSGGSGAAVAARIACATLGSDTGGSIRQPASHCGVVGMKPTYGRVSRYGLVAFASSLDQIGPMTRDVRDCAILLNAIAGYDPKDSTSHPSPCPDYEKALSHTVSGLKIGIPKEYFGQGLGDEVEKAVTKAMALLKENGAELKEISLPHTEYAVATYYIIAPAEASSNLMRYDGVKYGLRAEGYKDLLEMYKMTRSQGFGPEVKRRIMLGTYSLSSGYYDAYYKKASQVRTVIRKDFIEAFKECDCILTPVAPTPAFKLGEKLDDPLQMYLSDIFTIPVNLAGLPAISVPCTLSNDGLPIGVQFVGPPFKDEVCIHVGGAFEAIRGPFAPWPEL